MKTKLLFVALVSIALLSCKSEEQILQDKIDYTFSLLDRACAQPETDMSIPLGFDLSVTEKEFESYCNKLIASNGGKHVGTSFYITTSDFGGIEREVCVGAFPYFSDPNTRTEYISSVHFRFDEFRDNHNSNGGWSELKKFIDGTFDNSWTTSEFDLSQSDNPKYSEYYKYWVRGNMAVEFYYDGYKDYVTLEFFNMPKYGTHLFKSNIEMILGIKAKVKAEFESAPKYDIQNSPWDGSVWQVRNYVKSLLKDPSSYESIEWSNVVKDGSTYRVRHRYRAKNSFGAYVVEEYVFVLDDKGKVIEMSVN